MELQAYKKYSFYLIMSLVLTTIGTFIGSSMDLADNVLAYGIASIVIILLFSFSSGMFKKLMFVVFCIGEGVFLTPIIDYYTSTSFYGCLLATTIVVSIFAFIGFKAKNLSGLGAILFPCLLGVVAYYIVGWFIPLPSISLLVIVLFIGYVSYDMNRFKLEVQRYGGNLSNDEILDHVMNMYLDIINIFLHLLSIFGDSND